MILERLASQSQRSSCLCLSSAGIKGMCHNCLLFFLGVFHTEFFCVTLLAILELALLARLILNSQISASTNEGEQFKAEEKQMEHANLEQSRNVSSNQNSTTESSKVWGYFLIFLLCIS